MKVYSCKPHDVNFRLDTKSVPVSSYRSVTLLLVLNVHKLHRPWKLQNTRVVVVFLRIPFCLSLSVKVSSDLQRIDAGIWIFFTRSNPPYQGGHFAVSPTFPLLKIVTDDMTQFRNRNLW